MLNNTLFTFSVLLLAVTLAGGCAADQPQAGQTPDARTSDSNGEPEQDPDGSTEQEASEITIEDGLAHGEYFNQARRAMVRGEYPRAVKLAEKAVEGNPEFDTYLLTLADARFMNCEIEEAINAYDRLIEVNPNSKPFLWQRGLALYYAGEFEEGVAQFEFHQTVNNQDVENAIWHMLCAANVESVESARENLIEISGDRREWSREVYNLFAGNTSPGDMTLPLPPAEDINRGEATNRYYANLYLGLYYEMTGETEKCLEHMKFAADGMPFSRDQLMGQIAAIHLRLREK